MDKRDRVLWEGLRRSIKEMAMAQPRLEFSCGTKRAALQRSMGVCECDRVPQLCRPQGCGRQLDEVIYFEHIVADAIRQDNSLANCAVLCAECWREKTARYDLPTIAKSNRVRHKHAIHLARMRAKVTG